MLFSATDRRSDTLVELRDQRLLHLRDVLQAKEGDELRVGEIDGQMGVGRLVSLQTDRAQLEVILRQTPPQKLPIVVVMALPRPKMLRRILRSIAEFGVGELHLIHSFRVEKSYWQSPVLRPDTLRNFMLQGLSQGVDTVLPTVTCHRRFKPFVEDRLPGIIGSSDALVAHPYGAVADPVPTQKRTIAVLGPEGGFIPYEVAALEAVGCRRISLGERVLRVENAVSALLGRLVL